MTLFAYFPTISHCNGPQRPYLALMTTLELQLTEIRSPRSVRNCNLSKTAK